MPKTKYYAVARGKKTGVFTDWPTTQKLVTGYQGARYKSFPTRAEAAAWVAAGGPRTSRPAGSARTRHQAAPVRAANSKKYAVTLWSDGGSRNHGNVLGGHVKQTDVAAWAYLLVTQKEQKRYSGSDGEFGATNNRMEIMGLLNGLRRAEALGFANEPILATLDSQYVLNAVTKGWLAGWQRRGWRRAGDQPLANAELWRELAGVLPHFSHLDWQWTKGHATNEGNVFVDHLLNDTMDRLLKARAGQS